LFVLLLGIAGSTGRRKIDVRFYLEKFKWPTNLDVTSCSNSSTTSSCVELRLNVLMGLRKLSAKRYEIKTKTIN
jgi:hypothetical protein